MLSKKKQKKGCQLWQLCSIVTLVNVMAFVPINLVTFANESVAENNNLEGSTSAEDLGKPMECTFSEDDQDDCGTGSTFPTYSPEGLEEEIKLTPEERDDAFLNTNPTEDIPNSTTIIEIPLD